MEPGNLLVIRGKLQMCPSFSRDTLVDDISLRGFTVSDLPVLGKEAQASPWGSEPYVAETLSNRVLQMDQHIYINPQHHHVRVAIFTDGDVDFTLNVGWFQMTVA